MNATIALLVFATALVLASGIALHRRTGDVFHPAVSFAAFSAMMYVVLPAYLLTTQFEDVNRFLSIDRMITSLTVVLAVLAGCVLGFRVASKRLGPARRTTTLSEGARDRPGELSLLVSALVLLALGAVGYGTNLADYGWASLLAIDAERYAEERPTGYLGELTHALLPAALIGGMLASTSRYKRTGLVILLIALMPWILSALAGGRRGPAIMAVLGFVFATAFWRRSLRLPTFMGWIAFVALAVTFLIANRGTLEQRNYGDWAPLTEAVYLNAFEGNEFIYGGAAIAVRAETGEFYWGRRQIMTYVVRPVPRHLWPDKYEAAAEWLGLPEWQASNNAVFPTMAVFVLGWTVPLGAAPGLAADLWIDWGPAAPVVGAAMAYLLTLLWWRGRLGNIYAGVLYGIAFTLMAYFVTQGVEAFLVRFLFLMAVVWIVFKLCGVRSHELAASALSRSLARPPGRPGSGLSAPGHRDRRLLGTGPRARLPVDRASA